MRLFLFSLLLIMGKIVTLTFNPVIDKSTTIARLIPEKKLRCKAPTFEPGGGGINVARAIKKFGGEAIAVYPAGGYSGNFLQILMKEEGIDSVVIETQKHTRENLIVVDESTNQQYRFGMPGPELSEQEWKLCLQKIRDMDDIEFIVASGSLNPGMPEDIYGQLAVLAKEEGAKLIVDTSGEPLKHAAKAGVYLLKPNLAELSSLVGKEEINDEMVDDVAKQLIDEGKCEIVVVSMGATGAMLISKDEAYHMVPPPVKKKSTVGAGDCMVAGIIYSLSKGEGLKEALKYGVASGTASTMNPGTSLAKPEDVHKLHKLIREHVIK